MRVLLPLLLLLAACVPPSGTLSSRDTGLSGSYSRQVPISNDIHHVLYGHVIEAAREGEVIRALVVSQRRDRVHSECSKGTEQQESESRFHREG